MFAAISVKHGFAAISNRSYCKLLAIQIAKESPVLCTGDLKSPQNRAWNRRWNRSKNRQCIKNGAISCDGVCNWGLSHKTKKLIKEDKNRTWISKISLTIIQWWLHDFKRLPSRVEAKTPWTSREGFRSERSDYGVQFERRKTNSKARTNTCHAQTLK